MPSLNSPGDIPIVDKQNTSLRNEGGALVTTSGLLPQTGPTSLKVSTIHMTQGHDRVAADFGTQPDRDKSQYSTLNLGGVQKVTTSDDASLTDGDIKITSGTVAPDTGNQPEIANKPVSQYSTYHTGGRVVTRNSSHDNLIARNANDSVRP